MILFGCLLAFSAAVAPRLVLILAWIFSDRWPLVWQGDWIMPLLGIIFLPYTTIMYLLSWTPTGGIEGWDWLWILIGLFLDFMKWSQIIANRRAGQDYATRYYPEGAPGASTMRSLSSSEATMGAEISSGAAPASTSTVSQGAKAAQAAPPENSPDDDAPPS